MARSCVWAAAGLAALASTAAATPGERTVLHLDGKGEARSQRSFTNTTPIPIPVFGAGSLYPSTITVSGVAGSTLNVSDYLFGFGHTLPDDVDILLVSPRGTRVVLMSDGGGAIPVSNLDLTIEDFQNEFTQFLPDETTLDVPGHAFRGRNWGGLDDLFPTPAPTPGAVYTSTNAFKGEDPNGVWSLYVVDDQANPHSGAISGGWSILLGASDANVTTVIPDGDGGPAGPYPHEEYVNPVLDGRIERVRVRLQGLSHDRTADLDVLLQGPGGQTVMLMSDVGGIASAFGETLVFDDAAPGPMPPIGLTSGTYRPTNLGAAPDIFQAPAPVGPYGSALSVFNNTRPGGFWKLWVMDDLDVAGGEILNWGLDITVVNKGDFDRDDQTDLLWRHDTSGQNVFWYMEVNGLRDGELTSPPVLADTRWKMVGTHDFNADGKSDILWRHSTAGENVVWLMDKNVLASGTFTTPPALADVSWQMAGTGDFNGDAKPDILWRHEVSGENVAWFMNGTVLTSGTFLVPPSLPDTNWKIVGTGYFNDDVQLDILWWHQGSGQLVAWFMNGITMTGGELTSPPGITDTQWRPVATGDYNRDNREDIVWRHQVTGDNMIWHMGGPNGTTRLGSQKTDPSSLDDTRWKIVGPR